MHGASLETTHLQAEATKTSRKRRKWRELGLPTKFYEAKNTCSCLFADSAGVWLGGVQSGRHKARRLLLQRCLLGFSSFVGLGSICRPSSRQETFTECESGEYRRLVVCGRHFVCASLSSNRKNVKKMRVARNCAPLLYADFTFKRAVGM